MTTTIKVHVEETYPKKWIWSTTYYSPLFGKWRPLASGQTGPRFFDSKEAALADAKESVVGKIAAEKRRIDSRVNYEIEVEI